MCIHAQFPTVQGQALGSHHLSEALFRGVSCRCDSTSHREHCEEEGLASLRVSEVGNHSLDSIDSESLRGDTTMAEHVAEAAHLTVDRKRRVRDGLEFAHILQRCELTSFYWAPLPKVSRISQTSPPPGDQVHSL